MAKTDEATKKHQPVGQNVSATRRVARLRRHARLRKKVAGTAERPRLMVNRSSRHIHVQLIDDLTGTTLAAASSIEADVRGVDGEFTGSGAHRRGEARRRGDRGLRPRRLLLRRADRGTGRRRP